MLIEQLINALRCLPGVGPKSAQRMAFHILERNRENGLLLAKTLEQAITHVGHCKQCRTFSESDLCPICYLALWKLPQMLWLSKTLTAILANILF